MYGATWQLALHNDVYAELVESIMQAWSELVRVIIEEGVENGTFRECDANRTTRQLISLLSGYDEFLGVRPSAEKCVMVQADIADFIQRFIYKV